MSDALNLALTITAADLFSGVMRKFENRITGAGGAARRVRKDYDTMVTSVNRGIKSLAVGGYIAAKMRPGIAAAADLQEEMIGVRAELGGAGTSAAELARHLTDVRKTAFGVQSSTPFNIGQVVALEKELIKAGANIQDVIGERGAAAASAALATYEKLDPVLTGKALIGIGTPFKIAASGYADLADQISRAASASTTGAAEIAEAAKYAAGPLASMQRSSSEMLTLIALMAQQGVKGSMAGTSLKNFFLKAAEQQMFRNANGELKSTVEIIEILRKKTDGMGGHSAVAF
ncbi:phage tail tape measure protein [Candidatus Vondammii sp. HM_W22]|uniref:phage tail tape measure protein n=1 Tax=Candidatus Vondammii sp. HM_W22 TaxID=2687299 RepID=UPI001F13C357|nr:phage tail tape measure protein [Candidatus Vondammii sp. HM_W22]